MQPTRPGLPWSLPACAISVTERSQAMYTLYWAPGSAAMAPQAVLEEIGAPYEAVKLDTASRQHEQAEYRRLNPNGRIPTLVDGDFVIFETAAICQSLCDRNPEANLLPPAGSPARARISQWLPIQHNLLQYHS